MARIRFREFNEFYSSCSDYFISNRQNNGDWDYWIVIELLNNSEAGLESDEKYTLEACVVSPTAAKDKLEEAADSFGLEAIPKAPVAQVQLLKDYGTYARVYQATGNNKHKMLKACKDDLELSCGLLFGVTMDKAQNALGSTGWDFVAGNVMAGLYKYIKHQVQIDNERLGPFLCAEREVYRNWSRRVGGSERRYKLGDPTQPLLNLAAKLHNYRV